MDFQATLLPVAAFLLVSGAVLVVAAVLGRDDRRVLDRLHRLASGALTGSLPNPGLLKRAGASQVGGFLRRLAGRLVPNDEERRSRLQFRLMHAGFYEPIGPAVFQAVKALLLVTPIAIGMGLVYGEVLPSQPTLFAGLALGLTGMFLPDAWLVRRKRRRQALLNKSLPDALDLMVACVEAGLSLEGALKRLPEELRFSHPTLAGELGVVQRQIEFGATPEVAIGHFADRSDLESLRSLGTMIQHARRFGTGIIDALRTHTEMLRAQREQQAEELAQKAAVKILFPTLVLIFPATFVVLAGPAVIQLSDLFSRQPEGRSHYQSTQGGPR